MKNEANFIPDKNNSDIAKKILTLRGESSLKSINYFYDLMLKRFSDREFFAVGGFNVGYFCNIVPEEMIIACGATPVRLCSEDSLCASAGEELMPGDICPVIKSICGVSLNGGFRDINLLVIPATCDGKVKLAEILTGSNELYFLDLPRDSDYIKNFDVWFEKYADFYEFLKKKTGKKPSRKDLLSACRITNERTEIFNKIFKLRAQFPGLMSASDYFIMGNSSFFAGAAEWTEKAKILYEELLERKKTVSVKNVRKKIILAGSPVIFPNYKILEILEDAGCDIAAELMCSSYGRLADPVVIDEETENGIIRSLCLKYVSASMCPCFIGMKKLADRIVENVGDYGLDGVIYHNLRLCQVFEMQTVPFRLRMREEKIPFLSVKTDLSSEDTGQLKTRIEAFLEMLG